MEAVNEQLYIPPGNLVDFHGAQRWHDASFENLEIRQARAGFPLAHELGYVMVFHVSIHGHHRPRQSDDLRLYLEDDLLEPAIGLPFGDFILVTEILRFPLPPWLVFGSHPIKTLPVRPFHVVTETNVSVATPRHLFNPPVTGSHASVCKINTVPTGLASLEPTLDLSESEPRSISDPDGCGNRIWGVDIMVHEAKATLKTCR